MKNKNLPVYNGQSVKLILLDNMVIGFIDISTGFYYYLSNNLKETIQGPTSWWLAVVAVIVCFVAGIFIIGNNIWLYALLILLPYLFLWYIRISSYFFRKKN